MVIICLDILNINLSTIIGNLGEKFYMILDGEVSVLIPNPENRNFGHWLKTLHEERKNYERLIERETKRLQLIKEKVSMIQKHVGGALAQRMSMMMTAAGMVGGVNPKLPPSSMKSSKMLKAFQQQNQTMQTRN
jgi:hypothetical protein